MMKLIQEKNKKTEIQTKLANFPSLMDMLRVQYLTMEVEVERARSNLIVAQDKGVLLTITLTNLQKLAYSFSQ